MQYYISFVCILHSCEQGFVKIAWIFASSPSLTVAPALEFSSPDGNFNSKVPQKPVFRLPPAPSFSLFQERQSLTYFTPHCHVPMWLTLLGMICLLLLNAVVVLQTCRREEHRPFKSVRWPSASQGTIWWLLPSQLGPHSSSWYKSCQAASTPRIFKHLGL